MRYPLLSDRRGSGIDNVDEWYGALRCDLVEDVVKSVRRDQADLCSGCRKVVETLLHLRRHRSPVSRFLPIDEFLERDAVDQDLRVGVVTEATGVLPGDPRIVRDGRLWTHPPKYADSLHNHPSGLNGPTKGPVPFH